MLDRDRIIEILNTPILHVGTTNAEYKLKLSELIQPLPDGAKDLANRVVWRTKLWNKEKLAAAGELVAAFEDQDRRNAASTLTTADTEKWFENRYTPVKAAARRIRAQHLSSRALFFRVMRRIGQAFQLLCVAAVCYVGWLLSGTPDIQVDYLKRF
jgi:hypothetical protein